MARAQALPARAGLAGLSAKVRRGEALTIIAIGSSSTEGSDLPDKTLAYPTHLQRQLTVRLGTGLVRVLNKGRGGETMTETVSRFQGDVAGERPDLVVWQLGVNDVVRGKDMAESARNIENGMSILKTIGAPVVLMDMQLAPRVTASAQLPMMRTMLKNAAAKFDAVLWSRFDLMDKIVKSGDAKIADLIRHDGLHMTVPMHVCTGIVLADMIADGVSQRPQDMAAAN